MENHNYLLGKTFTQANKEVLPGYSLRVVEVDGHSLPITEDLRTDRVNLTLKDDVIVKIDGIY